MSKESYATKKDLEELGKAWTTKFETTIEELNTKIGEGSSSSTEASSPSEVKSEVPKYKCTGKNCGFYTDDGIEMILHEVREHKAEQKPTEEVTPPAPKKRHETVEDYLSCSECFPKFEKAFLDRGYTKPQPKKEEPSKKKATLI